MAKKKDKKEMVKVSVLRPFHVGNDTKVEYYKQGSTYLVDEKLAARLINNGFAKLAEEKKPDPESEKQAVKSEK